VHALLAVHVWHIHGLADGAAAARGLGDVDHCFNQTGSTATNTWQLVGISLGAFAGQQVRISFRGVIGGVSSDIGIDKVGISACDCPALSAIPANGQLGTCAVGRVNGTSCALTCNSTYVATGTQPFCFYGDYAPYTFACAAPCPLVAPRGGGNGTCTSLLQHQQSCAFSCFSSWVLSPSGSMTCNNGVLQPTLQVCKEPCAMTAPGNGTLGTCSALLSSGSSCAYACSAGYFLNPTSNPMMTCTNGAIDVNQTCRDPLTCDFESNPCFWFIGGQFSFGYRSASPVAKTGASYLYAGGSQHAGDSTWLLSAPRR